MEVEAHPHPLSLLTLSTSTLIRFKNNTNNILLRNQLEVVNNSNQVSQISPLTLLTQLEQALPPETPFIIS